MSIKRNRPSGLFSFSFSTCCAFRPLYFQLITLSACCTFRFHCTFSLLHFQPCIFSSICRRIIFSSHGSSLGGNICIIFYHLACKIPLTVISIFLLLRSRLQRRRLRNHIPTAGEEYFLLTYKHRRRQRIPSFSMMAVATR